MARHQNQEDEDVFLRKIVAARIEATEDVETRDETPRFDSAAFQRQLSEAAEGVAGLPPELISRNNVIEQRSTTNRTTNLRQGIDNNRHYPQSEALSGSPRQQGHSKEGYLSEVQRKTISTTSSPQPSSLNLSFRDQRYNATNSSELPHHAVEETEDADRKIRQHYRSVFVESSASTPGAYAHTPVPSRVVAPVGVGIEADTERISQAETPLETPFCFLLPNVL